MSECELRRKREKINEMGEGDVCVWWGRRKKKGRGYMRGGKKKNKEIKKKKEMGSGVYVYGGKKGRVEKERRK